MMHKLSNNVLFTHLVTALLLFLLTISITPIKGDTSQQEQPPAADQDDQHTSEASSNAEQLADPEHLKRELKQVALRRVDADKDGFVSYEELKTYLAALHEKTIEYNVDKQWTVYQPQIHEVFSWEGYEPERKEVLTWDHYFNQTYPELMGIDVGIPINREQDTARILSPPAEQDKGKEKEAKKGEEATEEAAEEPHMRSLKQMVRRADARWKLADENGDTLLTKSEFKLLLHPDEGYEELQNLFVREATEDMDLNKDGKICMTEFMKHMQVLASDQERSDQSWLSSQQENFGRFLDKNKDGELDAAEIREWLVPAKSKKFEMEAKRLFDIGDDNEDHKLSTGEIMDHFDQYLGLLPPEYWSTERDSDEPPATADDGQTARHDEL